MVIIHLVAIRGYNARHPEQTPSRSEPRSNDVQTDDHGSQRISVSPVTDRKGVKIGVTMTSLCLLYYTSIITTVYKSVFLVYYIIN